MKKNLIFICIILLVRCNPFVKGEHIQIESTNTLSLQKYTESEDYYESFKEITDKDKVDRVLTIFRNARWVAAFDKSTYPDFIINEEYELWILSPDNRIKIRMDCIDKNTVLSKKDSKIIYTLLQE